MKINDVIIFSTDSYMKFVDLFAGLGGFHAALQKHGHQCVFACEIEKFLREHYHKNFKLYPDGDISKVNINKINLQYQILIFYVLVFHANPFQK